MVSSLNALRKNKTFLPIVLKGSEGIYNSRTFTLKLEKAVKATLAEKGITVAVPSQFERYISHIETKHAINWDEIIANDEYLSSTVASKNDILKKLHSNDVDFMGELEDALNKQDIDVLSSDEKSLSKWLSEVTSELQKAKKADAQYKDYWHKVKAGESMYTICQFYGIRLDALYKMNFKDDTYIPVTGDLLKVR